MRRVICALLVLAFVAAGCASEPEVVVFPTVTPIPDPTPTPAAADDIGASAPGTALVPNIVRDAEIKAATFDIRECDLDLPDGVEAECRWFHVPYAHWDVQSPDLHLAATIIKSPNPNAASDPVVYLSGGPGYPGGDPDTWARSPLLADRDIIVFDQRGTGESEINMECVDVESAVVETLATNDTFEDERNRMGRAIITCYDDLRARAAYLNGFDTTTSAHDLEALRLGLGIERWNLLGVSYGTRLALESMRLHPEGIRSVILDSVYPTTAADASALATNADRAVLALADACQADPACAADHPDLWNEILDLVAQYDAQPAQVSVTVDGANVNLTITGADLYAGLFTAMYDTDLIPQIPDLVTALADGNTALAGPVAQQGIEFVTSAAEAMAFSTECGDRPASGDPQPLADLMADPGRHSTMLLLAPAASCEWWNVAFAWEGFNEPVSSDIPTLVTAGRLDPVTPPWYGETAAETLSDVLFVEFGEVGHGAVFASDCAMDIARSHLNNPGGTFDTSCVSSAGPEFG